MIITKLVGGLGNQMFQYAAGRALAMRQGCDLFVDRRSFVEYKVHAYGLDCFRAKVDDAPAHMLPQVADSRIRRIFRSLTSAGRVPIVRERAFTFQPDLLQQRAPAYLDGYWQSEKYFSDFADAIRKDFTVGRAPSPANAAWLARIGTSLSVSIHVRRGDYVTNTEANKFHGTCDIDYYERAVRTLCARLDGSPEFFVFSDDPAWVRANLNLGAHTHHYITDNDASTNYEDLRLMSACRHHIIANSTFSWWGAWLNPSRSKIVVAPQRWFRADEMDDRDLVPPEWVRA
jgi:hypothetical protein